MSAEAAPEWAAKTSRTDESTSWEESAAAGMSSYTYQAETFPSLRWRNVGQMTAMRKLGSRGDPRRW